MPQHKLQSIQESNSRDPERCKHDVLDTWLRNDLKASWKDVTNALCEMGERKLAERIDQIHYVPIHSLKSKMIILCNNYMYSVVPVWGWCGVITLI